MKFLLALALTLAAAPAMAAPLPMAIVSVETPGVPFGTSERVDAVIATLTADGLIAAERPQLAVKKLKACGRSATREACVRDRLRKRPPLALPVHLAVMAYPGEGAQLRLVCVGPGRRLPWRPAPEAYVDVSAALSEGPGAAVWRQRLVDCLAAAAEERRL